MNANPPLDAQAILATMYVVVFFVATFVLIGVTWILNELFKNKLPSTLGSDKFISLGWGWMVCTTILIVEGLNVAFFMAEGSGPVAVQQVLKDNLPTNSFQLITLLGYMVLLSLARRSLPDLHATH